MLNVIEIVESPTNGSVCLESYGITALLWDDTQWVSNSHFKVNPFEICCQKDQFLLMR